MFSLNRASTRREKPATSEDVVQNSYELNDGVYALNDYGRQHIKDLDLQLYKQIAYLDSKEYSDKKANPADENNYENFIKKYDDRNLKQKSIYAKINYLKNSDTDINKIQMDYLFNNGWLMIVLSLLIFILSFTSVSLTNILSLKIAKEKREEYFTKIMKFSNEEINKYIPVIKKIIIIMVIRMKTNKKKCLIILVLFQKKYL